MIAYNPNSPMALWYLAWMDNVRRARQFPTQSWGYENAAAMSQCQYLCYLAQEMAREKSQ